MNFAIGDLRNRYRNSVLGVIWTVLEPLLILTVLYVIFSSILRPNVPNFAIYLLLGLITWNFIRNSTSMSIESITSKKRILANIYFMRAIPAFSSNISGLIMLGIEFVVFSFFLIGFGVTPGLTILFLPFFILLIFMITLGLSLPLSVLCVSYKDIKFIWHVVLTAGFFLHPILYTLDMLPEKLQEILSLVPTVRLLEMIHDVVLFDRIPDSLDFSYVIISAFVILISGYLIYRKFEYRVVEQL